MNEGAAEGVAMEGNDRRGKTCSSRLKLLEKSRSFFLPKIILRSQLINNDATGFETK